MAIHFASTVCVRVCVCVYRWGDTTGRPLLPSVTHPAPVQTNARCAVHVSCSRRARGKQRDVHARDARSPCAGPRGRETHTQKNQTMS